MVLSSKSKTAIGTAIGVALGVVLDIFLAVPLLNLETWAKENGHDTLYKLLPPEWLVTAWGFVVGPFGWGFALAALIFGLWEHRNVLSKSKRQQSEYEKEKAALVKLRQQGVALRNELLEPKDNFDWKDERKKLVRWSNRVVKRLNALGVSIELVAWFETFGKYDPKGPIGKTVTDEGQIKLTTMYNEKIERLEEIIDIPPVPPQG